MPVGGDTLEVQRRELALGFVLIDEVEVARLVGAAVTERCLGFARIVVAVVVEEDDLAADLRLQPPGGSDLGREEPAPERTRRVVDRNRCGEWVSWGCQRLRGPSGRAEHNLDGETEQHAGRRPDEVVPEVADVERLVEDEDEGLRGNGGPEDCCAADPWEEERDEEDCENRP